MPYFVAGNHRPRRPPVVTEGAVPERSAFKLISRVPGHEVFDHVRVRDDHACEEQELREILEVIDRDVPLHLEHLPERDDERNDHRDAGVDGTGNEIRREDGRVPPRDNRDGEVPRHHRVHREDERRCQGRHIEVSPRVVAPLVVAPAPPQRRDGVQFLPPPRRLVSNRRDIRNEPEDQEESAHRQVCRHCEDIEHQRRFEIHPQLALVRIREEPIRVPNATDVNEGEQPGGQHGKHRHRFRRPIDGGSPRRPEQVQDRRDERARVSNTDPEDEGRDVHAPHYGRGVSGNAQTVSNLVEQCHHTEREHRQHNAE